ncbi:MAG: LytTR family DNA-binding domain-containing protein [Marinilabiliales bacterium]|nr:LytTR family DNA-binding domain-containing protein [Marinilabiliales bacterium]
MKIKCIAIDDEPLALKQIGVYIEKTPFLECVALCSSAIEALKFAKEQEIDLMFVDINMPDLNGMDFVKSLEQKIPVIFTTAYSEYAIEGFQVNALDYLLKPISYASFLKSANKARSWFDMSKKPTDPPLTAQDYLFVKSEHRLIRILLSDIKYIEGSNEYIIIHLLKEKPVTTLMRMKHIETELPEQQFMRVHRSFIVNLSQVKVIERNRIIFDEKIYIPIGEQYKENFQKFLDRTFYI